MGGNSIEKVKSLEWKTLTFFYKANCQINFINNKN